MAKEEHLTLLQLPLGLFQVGLRVRAYNVGDTVEEIRQTVRSASVRYGSHVPSSLQYVAIQVRQGSLKAACTPTEAWILNPLIKYARAVGSLHVHANEDESVHLLAGELEVTIGDQTFTFPSGETYFAPKKIQHRLRNRSETPARALLLTTPGGFDAFVSQASIRVRDEITPLPELQTPNHMEKLLKLAAEFGIKIIAPPEPPESSPGLVAKQ